MTRASLFAFALWLGATALALPARADDVTEASALFESGNAHFQAGMRARGARRQRELEAALEDYFASLQRVRSRNVVYNCALVLEQLERWDDAFNYWSEYVAVSGLSETERADGESHRDALRPRVAVARIESDAVGASVWVDRRDLASRGSVPLEIALPPGEHALWLVHPGFEDAASQVTVQIGSTEVVRVSMTAEDVMVQVLAPEGVLRLDGAEIRAGASLPVAPGPHQLTLELPGSPSVERRFEVLPGAPMVIDLTAAVAALPVSEGAVLHVLANAPTRISVDGLLVANGVEVDVPIAPGRHEIMAEPSMGPAWHGSRAFGDEDLTLHLRAHGTSGDLMAARGVFGALSILGVLAGGGLALSAGLANEAYRNAPLQEGAFESVVLLNAASDITWGLTAALGITTIVFLIVDDAGTEASFDGEVE